MDGVKMIVLMLDYALDTGRKQHIIGGILLSASLFFGDLALTTLTIKAKEDLDEEQHD